MKRNTKLALAVVVVLIFVLLKTFAPDRATWYGPAHRGKLMADGRRFNPDALTAASWDYPLGSKLKILHGGKSVMVEVTDRGGVRRFFQLGKTIDLSRAAFAQLAKLEAGSISVRIERVK